jgi:cysteine desulfurase / selenocysteine lyase
VTNLAHLRADFPILTRLVNGRPLVYLDSAASSQKPVQVIEAMADFYRTSYANVHRGAYTLSDEATAAYEAARVKAAAMVGAASSSEVVFTRGTTGALNTVAYGWGLDHLRPGDRIVLTILEHHSNIVPWQLVARRTGAELAYLTIGPDYQVDPAAVESVVDERTRILAVSAMSNVTGTMPPVAELAAAAHAVGAVVVVDGAQAVPHLPVDVTALGADFLAWSGHKMLGPTGIGCLWGRADRLEEMSPLEGGGEMISDVGLYDSRWAPVPHKFEAGTPPIAEAVGLGAAVDYLEKVGMAAVRAHEVDITRYALDRLAEVPDLVIHGPRDIDQRGGAISFTLGDIHAHDIATIVDEENGVAIRAGHHCAKPLMAHLELVSTARASFYVYTNEDDIDQLVAGLHTARRVFGLG